MESLLLVAPLVLAVLGLVGCSTLVGTPSDQVPARGILRSKKPRAISPDVPATNLAELVAGNSAFAFDLYQAIRGEAGNLFLSPYSISLALVMTYAGARGDTEQQMVDTLRYTFPQGRLHPAFNSLDLELASRAEGVEGQDGRFRLNIADSIWGQTGHSFLPQYLDVLAGNYGAGLRVLDFVNEPEDSRVTINDWVSDETEAKIKDLLPPNSITPATVLVLTNAIYFNAAWLQPFVRELTHDGTFNLLDGDQVTVPMMKQTAYFGYAEGEGYKAVELPYDGEELSMVILLPEAGRFEEFTSALDSEAAALILADVSPPQDVQLTMPRFTYESGFSLKETLAGMGMPVAFARADFSGMDGTRSLFIDDVFHKAFVDVDEAGTEAEAATGWLVAGVPIGRREVTVNRPFFFMIRDIDTRAILFLGHVVNPSG